MKHISVHCQVQCAKCGWKSYRRLQVTAVDEEAAKQCLAASTTYDHLKCTGKVLVKRVIGSRTLQ